jgi:hypothetical protein
MRAWQVERRKRTRHLIELGGLVVKARVVELTGDDRAIILGALVWMADKLKSNQSEQAERSGPQRERRHSLWNRRLMRPPSRRKCHRIGHDRWRAARRLPPYGLSAESDCGSTRKNLPSIVNQILQTVRRNIQGCSIQGSLVASLGLGALRFQDIVNLVFDALEFGLGICFPYPADQTIHRVQLTNLFLRMAQFPEMFRPPQALGAVICAKIGCSTIICQA